MCDQWPDGIPQPQVPETTGISAQAVDEGAEHASRALRKGPSIQKCSLNDSGTLLHHDRTAGMDAIQLSPQIRSNIDEDAGRTDAMVCKQAVPWHVYRPAKGATSMNQFVQCSRVRLKLKLKLKLEPQLQNSAATRFSCLNCLVKSSPKCTS
jgi:hypothetical protein